MAAYEELSNVKHKVNPKSNAGMLSILTFSWMNDIFAKGYKRPLENVDLYPLMEGDRTKILTKRLQQTWHDEVVRQLSGQGRKKHLLRALMRLISLSNYVFIVGTAFLSSACNILQPLFLSLLLPLLIGDATGVEFHWAYLYGAGICVCNIVRGLATYQWTFSSRQVAMRMRSAAVGLIYATILQFNQDTLTKVTCGNIMSLVSCDLQRFDLVVVQTILASQALLELLAVVLLAWYILGPEALTGFLFLFFLGVYYFVMGVPLERLRSKIAPITDKRLSMMNAIISGIRTVKMFAWEWPYMALVQKIRSQEVRLLCAKNVITATFWSLQFTCQPIASCLSLVTLAATGHQLNVTNIFFLLCLIGSLRASIASNVPKTTKIIADFWTAIDRIQTLLEVQDVGQLTVREKLKMSFRDEVGIDKTKEQPPPMPYPPDRENQEEKGILRSGVPKASSQIVLHQVSCYRNRCKGLKAPALSNITLSIAKGELVLITGPVGCGKSSLLLAILEELFLDQGTLSCSGRKAYVSQQPWLFSGTVQENILFGLSMDTQRYRMVIEACALSRDIERFPSGDSTVIGERGVVLSGGQRLRVGLARALYADADVYLLDDPLSAVDAKVGKHIFDQCILGVLSGKTRILVTHRLQFIQGMENIVVMKEGRIAQRGSFAQLTQSGMEFDTLESKHISNVNAAGEHPPNEGSFLEYQTTSGGGLEIVEEDRQTGSVSFRMYWQYLRAGLHPTFIVMLGLFFCLAQAVLAVSDWWLVELSRTHGSSQDFALRIYGVLVCGAVLLSFTRAALFLSVTLNSSRNLHKNMLISLLKAPVLFFDTNPIGRILNRFSGDMNCVDELLPDTFLDVIQNVLFCISAIVLPSVLNPWILLVVAPLVVIFLAIGRYYVRSSREIKRLESLNRSPLLAHFADSLGGLVAIRAYKTEKNALEELYRCQDAHNQTYFLIFGFRWLSVRLDLLCTAFVSVVVFVTIATHSEPGLAALSIVYAIQLAVDTSQYSVVEAAEVDKFMTSVERVITYTKIEPEPGYAIESQPPEEWPQKGEIQIKNMNLVYYQGGTKVLRDISITVPPQQKVGLVGRTGAGKSSVVAALFRMPEPTGEVVVDGVDLGSINIQSTRRAISVISQNPVLFTGTVRMNLDPFERYTDDEVWDALTKASVSDMITSLPQKLMNKVSEFGANFSVGERQLLCLARALLERKKIIVLDEATAHVDSKTDRVIQETIRSKFQQCTVITVAHRLNTVIDYDKILVLKDGQVAEFDEPNTLLKKEGGEFAALYKSCMLPLG